MQNDPFSLSNVFQTCKNDKLNHLLWSPIEQVLGFRKLSLLHRSQKDKKTPQIFIKAILKHLEISYAVKVEDKINKIPENGSLLIVSNHPFGALEALILTDHLSEYRSDIRILANVFLKRISFISDLLFGVNPFNDPCAKNHNRKVMREIHKWLAQGHCLVTFPSGNVSHLHLKKPYIADGTWDPQIARLARLTNSNVLPVYIKDRNSWFFYLFGPKLHALLYGRELLNKQGKCFKMCIGKLISAEEIKTIVSDSELIKLFRKRSDYLVSKSSEPGIDPVD